MSDHKEIEIAAGSRVYLGGQSHPFGGGHRVTLRGDLADSLITAGHAVEHAPDPAPAKD